MIELGARLTRCEHWRWMPGMRGVDSNSRKWRRVGETWVGESHAIRTCRGSHAIRTCRGSHAIRTCRGEMLPDLTDPATLGCLLALVREAWGVGSLVYRPWNGAIRGWRVVTFAHDEDWMTVARVLGEGATEAAALVAALEAAQ